MTNLKIGHLLDAVEIRDFVPSAFPEIFKLGHTIARFGRGLVALEDNPVALGRELLAQEDFFHCRSGLLDTHRVSFDIVDIFASDKPTVYQVTEHLKWMIDCRRHPETIKLIIGAVKKAGGEARKPGHDKDLADMNIDNLGKSMEGLLAEPATRNLAKDLLEGNLFKARAHLKSLDPVPVELVVIVRRMYVMWCLFDLQVMAARLFHAEWNALETGGMDDPNLVRVCSVGALIGELLVWAKRFEEAFKKGLTEAEIDSQLKAFIKDHGLEEHARRNGDLMGLSDEELSGGMSPDRRSKLLRFLNDVKARAELLDNAFSDALNNEPDDLLLVQRSKRKGDTTTETRLVRNDKKAIEAVLEARAFASTMRFSMPVLTALAYSVDRVVDTISKIPAGTAIVEFDGPNPESVETLKGKRRNLLRDDLLSAYRHVFVRDHYRLGKNKPKLSSPKDRFVITNAEARRFETTKRQLIFGMGQSPEAAIANGVGVSYDLKSELKILNNYRASNDREPEDEFIDWIFESSLAARLAGPLVKRSDIRNCAARVKAAE